MIERPKAARTSHWLLSQVVVVTIGMGALILYTCLGLFLVALPPASVDSVNWNHWASATFSYASSPIDLSVISPFEGLGGLMLPRGAWLNPGDLLPQIIPYGDQHLWSFLVVMLVIAVATFLLGRASGLPCYLSVISAQVMTMISFPPMFSWSIGATHLNLANLYVHCSPGIALLTGLGTFTLVAFTYLGRLSFRKNMLCMVLLPLLLIYSVLCNPLYTPMFFIPICLLLAGVLGGSDSKPVFLWRIIGASLCLIVCLFVNLPGFYRALFGYAARSTFPNELYVEVQQWDYLTGLIFQKGLATPAAILVIISCGLLCVLGTKQTRSFAASMLLFHFFMIGISLVYVYSGIRWHLPLPCYFEYGALPAYVVTGFLGLWILFQKLSLWFSSKRDPASKTLLVKWAIENPVLRLALVYTFMLGLPVLGMAKALRPARWRWISHQQIMPNIRTTSAETPSTGVVKYLQDELALGKDGHFRGSVASVLAVPGGGLMNKRGVQENAPFTKEHIAILGSYYRSFDPDLYMTGFWKLRIPTLEDNNHLVTPPFHFLFTRVLSRPQDYHSRNWAVITKVNPKVMAALGARFLLTDAPIADPLLTLRTQQTNADGIAVYVYEIQGANLGSLSPTHTVISTNASETISLMTSSNFDFTTTAILTDSILPSLARAKFGTIHFERGGVRVSAESRGPCLLVLPIQFSNSLRITSIQNGSISTQPKLLRVNLLETGVLFDGQLDIKLAHVFGLFRGIQGRIEDIEDCRRLAIKETGEIPYPANYQPLAKHNLY